MTQVAGSSLWPDPTQKITHCAGLEERAAVLATALPKKRPNLARGRHRTLDHYGGCVGRFL
jgi:hypothetical protein